MDEEARIMEDSIDCIRHIVAALLRNNGGHPALRAPVAKHTLRMIDNFCAVAPLNNAQAKELSALRTECYFAAKA